MLLGVQRHLGEIWHVAMYPLLFGFLGASWALRDEEGAPPLPDVVLADLHMPLMGGIEMVRRFRQAEAAARGIALVRGAGDGRTDARVFCIGVEKER
jgi:CheY-like chemotaxis protein